MFILGKIEENWPPNLRGRISRNSSSFGWWFGDRIIFYLAPAVVRQLTKYSNQPTTVGKRQPKTILDRQM